MLHELRDTIMECLDFAHFLLLQENRLYWKVDQFCCSSER
jgi:hypothetical protein